MLANLQVQIVELRGRGALRAVERDGGGVLATEHEIAVDDAGEEAFPSVKGLVIGVPSAIVLECREGEAVFVTFGVGAKDQVAEFLGELELPVIMEETGDFKWFVVVAEVCQIAMIDS